MESSTLSRTAFGLVLLVVLLLGFGGCSSDDSDDSEDDASESTQSGPSPSRATDDAPPDGSSPTVAPDEVSPETPTPSAVTPSPADDAPIVLDAGTLIREFERTPRTTKYKGRTLEITGTVKTVGGDYSGPYVDLLDDDRPSRDPFATYVSLQTSIAKAANFDEGDVVTVLARNAHANQFGDGSIVVIATLLRIVP